MIQNLLDPTILCFLIGLIAGLVKSDLRLPQSAYEFVSLYLLLAIGLKGGVQLAQTHFAEFLPALGGTLIIGFGVPIIAYYYTRLSNKFSQANCGALAAHYGSVSAVTFATAMTYIERAGFGYESFITTLLVVLEIPAICVGIYFAKGGFAGVEHKNKLLSEIFFGKSVFLLGGGLIVGYLAGAERMVPLNPFFVDLFKGFLALFLLELGVVTSHQMAQLKNVGGFLFVFALTMPLISGTLGLLIGKATGLSMGGAFLLAMLAASSSYIAAPSAMRIAVPEANPTYYLTASLALTFPFNITIGIPLFYQFARFVFGHI